MNPAKAAARLNGKVQSWESQMNALQAALARRSRRRARIKQCGLFLAGLNDSDVALAMGLISSEGARLMGRIMYAGQDEYRDDLGRVMMLELYAVPEVAGWQEPTTELWRVVLTAITERVRSPICVVCHGREYTPLAPGSRREFGNESLKVVCPECNGQGPEALGLATRARLSGMGRWYFERHWNGRYVDVILPKLDRYHDIFWSGLKRRLRP